MNPSPAPTLPSVPEPLRGLVDLALDVRWAWSHSADVIWRRLAPEVWERTHSPWHILQTVARDTLEDFAQDPEFVGLVRRHVDERAQVLAGRSWYAENCQKLEGAPIPSPLLGQVAYFSMEFGLTEALPIYSGGLGILAGDYLKAASDLGVPLVGIGILWQQGYFRQALSTDGEQIEFFPFNDPGQLPISPLRDSRGEWVSVDLQFPRRMVHLRVWEVKAGRVTLYLLDANDLMNGAADRGITSELYGGGPEMRLQQELILGIGGWRVLRALGVEAEICHLNEGHAAFAALERARCHMEDNGVGFEEALAATRAGNVFTTHTAVEAGFDRFPVGLVKEYLGRLRPGVGHQHGAPSRARRDRRWADVQHGLPRDTRERRRQRRQPPARRSQPPPVPAALPALAAGRGPRGPRDQRRARPLLGLARSRTPCGPSSAASGAGWEIQAASAI